MLPHRRCCTPCETFLVGEANVCHKTNKRCSSTLQHSLLKPARSRTNGQHGQLEPRFPFRQYYREAPAKLYSWSCPATDRLAGRRPRDTCSNKAQQATKGAGHARFPTRPPARLFIVATPSQSREHELQRSRDAAGAPVQAANSIRLHGGRARARAQHHSLWQLRHARHIQACQLHPQQLVLGTMWSERHSACASLQCGTVLRGRRMGQGFPPVLKPWRLAAGNNPAHAMRVCTS